jgi:hypothetical protein
VPSGIEYDRRAGQYRGPDGRFVGRSRIEALIQGEISQNQTSVRDLTTSLLLGSLSLPEWQTSIAQTLKYSHIRMGLLASGGRNATDSSDYGTIGAELRSQYQYLNKFAIEIEKGELSEAQILSRVNQYARSPKITFYKLELQTRLNDGFKRGRRLMDLQSNHCKSCINYQRLDWVNLSDVIAPGTSCECRMHCQCRIFYSRF